jgi:nucleoside-diphosphate-sugar epimerase
VSVLVTGGTGFVGFNVVRALTASGKTAVSYDSRGNPDADGWAFLGDLAEHAVFVEGDVTDLTSLRQALRTHQVESIVHTAAITAIGDVERRKPHTTVMVNVGGTATALEAARLESVRRFVYLSSAMIYGSGDPAVPVPEDQPIQPTGIYEIAKQAGEALVLRYMELFDLDPVILRLSAPYGPLEHPTGARPLMSPVFEWCRIALAGGTVRLDQDLERDFTYVEDTADAIVRAACVPSLPARVYNVAGGRNYRFSAVLETLHRISPTFDVVRTADDVDALYAQSLRGPLDSQRARRDLGWQPRPSLADGLKSYLSWLRTHTV